MQPTPYQSAEGWLPDPLGRYEYRWFNGTSWTADVSVNGQRYVDPYGATPFPTNKRNGAATASIVLGIIAVFLAWIPFVVVVGIVLAVVAIGLGISARRKAKADDQTNAGRATAGIVTGSVALVVSVLGIWLTVLVVGYVSDFIDPAPHTLAIDDCSESGSLITVTASLTNDGDQAHDYTIFAQSRAGDVNLEFATQIDGLEPDQAQRFTLRFLDSDNDFSCPVRLHVFGPLPFVTLGTPNG